MSVIPEITKEMVKEADQILAGVRNERLMGHTLLLINKDQPFGTVLLGRLGDKKYLITPAHVAKELIMKNKPVGLVIKPDDTPRTIKLWPPETFNFRFWDPKFKKSDLLTDPFGCKDLAFMEIPLAWQGTIDSIKEYINLSGIGQEDLNLSACYLGFGVLRVDDKIQMTTLGIVLHEKREKDGLDYYIARAMKSTKFAEFLNRTSITNFGGYSGGVLFLYDDKNVKLVGIAYFQNRELLDQEDGYVEVHFYGPRSLGLFLNECLSSQ